MSTWTQQPVGSLIDGLAAGVSVRSSASGMGGPEILKTSSVDRGRFVPAESKPILPADRSRARCSPTAGSLIMSRMNTPAMVGDVGYVPETLPNLYLPDRLWLARAKRGTRTDMRWLTYYFASEPGARELRGLATGTSGSMKNIPKQLVLGLEIAVPPEPEQRAIADAIQAADAVIASLKRLIAKKQAIKQGLMQQLLSGRTRLPGFSTPWNDMCFGDLAAPVGERVLPRSVDQCTRLVELEHIDGGAGRLVGSAFASDAISLKTVFRPGDVLFGKLRAYLRKFWFADTGGLCSTEIWALRARPGVEGRFVRYVVEMDRFIELASGGYGTHMPRSDWGVVRKLELAVPPIEEQRAIALLLQDSDTEIAALRGRLGKARAIKTGMMQQLLTGRVRLPVGVAS